MRFYYISIKSSAYYRRFYYKITIEDTLEKLFFASDRIEFVNNILKYSFYAVS
jgi:hypothetical protein